MDETNTDKEMIDVLVCTFRSLKLFLEQMRKDHMRCIRKEMRSRMNIEQARNDLATQAQKALFQFPNDAALLKEVNALLAFASGPSPVDEARETAALIKEVQAARCVVAHARTAPDRRSEQQMYEAVLEYDRVRSSK